MIPLMISRVRNTADTSRSSLTIEHFKLH